jgi:hypothetical protein
MIFPALCKEALQLSEISLHGQFNGLNQAASVLAKQRCDNGEVLKIKNQTCKMLRHLQIATALERHFTTVGIDHWLDRLRRNLAVLTADGSRHHDCNGRDDYIYSAVPFERVPGFCSESESDCVVASVTRPVHSENTDVITPDVTQSSVHLAQEYFYIGANDAGVQTDVASPSENDLPPLSGLSCDVQVSLADRVHRLETLLLLTSTDDFIIIDKKIADLKLPHPEATHLQPKAGLPEAKTDEVFDELLPIENVLGSAIAEACVVDFSLGAGKDEWNRRCLKAAQIACSEDGWQFAAGSIELAIKHAADDDSLDMIAPFFIAQRVFHTAGSINNKLSTAELAAESLLPDLGQWLTVYIHHHGQFFHQAGLEQAKKARTIAFRWHSMGVLRATVLASVLTLLDKYEVDTTQ